MVGESEVRINMAGLRRVKLAVKIGLRNMVTDGNLATNGYSFELTETQKELQCLARKFARYVVRLNCAKTVDQNYLRCYS